MQEAQNHLGGSDRENHQTKRRRHHVLPISQAQSIAEWAILVLLLLPTVIGPWLYGSVRLWSIMPLVFACYVALLLFFIRLVVFREERIQIPPGGVFFILIAVSAGVTSCFVSIAQEARAEFFIVASYVAAYWLWANMASHHKRWRWLLALLLLSATCMAWYALIQHGHESRMVLNLERPKDYGMRASGAYFCPNHFAHYLIIFLPVALALVFCRSAGFPLRLFSGYSLLVMLPPLYLTQSRSGWLGAMAGLGVTACLLALRKSIKHFIVAVIVVPIVTVIIAAALWMFSPMVQQRVDEALKGNIRIALWQDTLDMVQDRPWTGFGLGSYRWVYPHYRQHMISYLDPQYAHNEYLHLLAEAGIIGLSLVALLVVCVVFKLIKLMRRSEHEKDSVLIMGFAGSVVASLVHAAFDYNLHIFSNVHVLMGLAGIVVAGLFASGDLRARPIEVKGWRWFVGAAGILLSVFLILMAARLYAAYSCTLQGDRQRDQLQLEDAEISYQKALRIDPTYWPAHAGFGHVLRIRSFWNLDRAAKQQQAEESINHFQKALKHNPWNVDMLYMQSKVYGGIGEHQKAVEMARDLVQQAPFNRGYLSELGLRLRMAGEHQEALTVFREARKLGSTTMIEANIRWLTEKMKEQPVP